MKLLTEMPEKVDKMKLSQEQDRRRKLTDEQKEEIRKLYSTGMHSLNSLAREYGVSKKTILLIVNPESKAKSDARIKAHWQDYYDREEHNKAVKNLRNYKKDLLKKGELKESFKKLYDDVLLTESPYDIFNLITNKPKSYRIVYDANIDKYIICEADVMIHVDMLETAMEQYYYVGNKKVDNIMNQISSNYDGSVKSLLVSQCNYFDTGVSGAYDEETGETTIEPYLIFMTYVPKGEDNQWVKDDGYDEEYPNKYGSIWTRDSKLEDCDLYGIWNRPSNLEEKLIKESKEDLQKFIDYFGKETVDKFYKYKNRLRSGDKDLYKWMKYPPDYLKSELTYYDEVPSNTQVRKNAKKGADLLYSDNGWKVYKINDINASVYYGKDTEWCISASSGYDGPAHDFWDKYKADGYQIYFFIENGRNKYALQYKDADTYFVYDEMDRMLPYISNAPKIDGLPNLSDHIVPWFMRSLNKLYGIEENDINSLTFINNDNVMNFIETNVDLWQTAWEMVLKNGDTKYFYIYDQDELVDITKYIDELDPEELNEDLSNSKLTEREILDTIYKMNEEGYPLTFDNLRDNILLISPSGEIIGIDNWDTHSSFGDELLDYIYQNNKDLYDRLDSSLDISNGYDVIDVLEEELGFITLNSGSLPEEYRHKIVIMKKPTKEQYDLIEEWLGNSLENTFIFCRSYGKTYSLVDNSPKELIDKIQKYFVGGVLEESIGYRTETAYGSGVRDLQDVMNFEIVELGNVDIPWTLANTFDMKPSERMHLRNFAEDSERYTDKEKYDLVNMCWHIILRKYPNAKYALWLADRDVVKSYYDGTDEDIDEYEIEYSQPISDLDWEGKLYVFSELPTKVNKEK